MGFFMVIDGKNEVIFGLFLLGSFMGASGVAVKKFVQRIGCW